MRRGLPNVIEEVGFDFHWDNEKLWKLDIPVEEVSIDELLWHMDIPFWSSREGYYDLTPQNVLHLPEKYKEEVERVDKADLTYPLDIMFWKSRWVLLDGLHRLVKAKKLGLQKVKVRKIPQDMINKIKK
jgi:hypothetical protein